MDRRRFIRVVGGGVVLAAGGGLPGCSRGMPARAIEAWQGPGPEADVRRWILGYAILAPHSHNLQSWLVDLSVPGEIALFCDPARLLPETDPFCRQIMMSHGTFLEVLDLAARERGLRADLALFPEGEFGPERIDRRPVARIRLAPDPGIARDPLFAQVLLRRTSREEYEAGRAIPAEAVRAMAGSVKPPALGIGFAGADEPERLARHRDIASEAWKIELTTPRTILESYWWLRVGAAEIERHRDGLSLNDPFVVLMTKLGLFERTRAPKPGDSAIAGQIKDFDAKIAAGTAHGLSMQPLSQALQEYPEQQATYARIHELVDATPPGRTVQMWARVGYGPPVQPAPRRGVAAQVTRG